MEEEDKIIKLSFAEFLRTIAWLVSFNFRLSPFFSIARGFVQLVLNLSPLVNAYIFARLLDGIIRVANGSRDLQSVIPLLLVLFGYNVLVSGANYAYGYIDYVMGGLSSFRSPQLLYKHLNDLGIQTLENPEVANKVQRARETIQALDADFERTTAFISRIITLLSASFVIIERMPVIGLLIFASLLPEVISNRIHMKKDWNLYRSATEERRRAFWTSSALSETTNLQEITITGGFGYLDRIFRKFADTFMAADRKINKSWQSYGFGFDILTKAASIFGYFNIFEDLVRRLITVGDTTFLMRSLDIFVSSLSSASSAYTALYERCIRVNEARAVFEMKPLIEDGNIELPKLEAPPRIEFKGVSFKYPNANRFSIQGLDLLIRPGEKVAIVGENGAGKTTLVKLLSRFYRVTKGELFISGTNINDLRIGNWYKNLSVLFQDYNSYGQLTLRENILLGDPEEEADDNKIMSAAKKAGVHDFAKRYKDGYGQVLNEKFKGGTRPSTGQWQRIAIARFFYRNSPVVIFDEPTAAIDAASEAEIFGQIYKFFKNKTVIIISHRFSTVRNADRIYVMDEGRVVESGTHDELVAEGGKYAEAFKIQAEGYR